MIDDYLTVDNTVKAVVGVPAAGWVLRIFVSWLNKQSLADAGNTSQKDVIETLRQEARRWEERYDLEVKSHADAKVQLEATMELLGETRNQNKMLRMMLIANGVAPETIDKTLGIDDVH